jgi:hypothetical protein
MGNVKKVIINRSNSNEKVLALPYAKIERKMLRKKTTLCRNIFIII